MPVHSWPPARNSRAKAPQPPAARDTRVQAPPVPPRDNFPPAVECNSLVRVPARRQALATPEDSWRQAQQKIPAQPVWNAQQRPEWNNPWPPFLQPLCRDDGVQNAVPVQPQVRPAQAAAPQEIRLRARKQRQRHVQVQVQVAI